MGLYARMAAVPNSEVWCISRRRHSFLFTSYTLLLGVILLGFAVLLLLIPGIIPFATRDQFRRHKYLQEPF